MKKFLFLLLFIPVVVSAQVSFSIILTGLVPYSLHISIDTLDYYVNPSGAFQETLGKFNIKSNSNNNISIRISSNNNFNLVSGNSTDKWSYTLILVDSQGGEIFINKDIELIISKLRMENFTLKATYPSLEESNLFSDLYEDYITIMLSSN